MPNADTFYQWQTGKG